MKPTVILAFANSDRAHLPLLKKESEQLNQQLSYLHDKGAIEVFREESTSVDELTSAMNRFDQRICIFHYAGHAGGEGLELEGGDAQASGLANLLQQQGDELAVVFLNGCSTLGQVDRLMELGVKAVVATSVPIEDAKAVEFSNWFYQALAQRRTLKNAFDFASASLQTKYKDAPQPSIIEYRGLLTREEKDAFPWGLYVKKDQKEILNWRMPYYREIGLPKEMIQYIGQNVKLDKYIVLVLDEMAKYNKDIYTQMVETKDGKEVKKDSSTYLDLVIQNFPWVIGSQIQLLRHFQKPDRNRLEQLVSTYLITSKVLYYILLSNCWDEKRRLGFDLPKDFLNKRTITQANYLQFDFIGSMLALMALMKKEHATLFIPEYEALCADLQADSHLGKAWKFLEKQRQEYVNVADEDLEKQCLTTEQALALMLKSAAFLADYQMLTIRNISIENPRFQPEAYELKMGPLNALVNTSLSLYEDVEKRRKETYANCQSIVLVPNETDLKYSLNLSPFIIDKNTFLNNDHIDLFVYAYTKDDAHHYLAVKHGLFVGIQDEKGTDIIHTGMSLQDFEEGRNINKQAAEDDFGFGDAFGIEEEEVGVEEGAQVFQLLDEQFELFTSDFS